MLAAAQGESVDSGGGGRISGERSGDALQVFKGERLMGTDLERGGCEWRRRGRGRRMQRIVFFMREKRYALGW